MRFSSLRAGVLAVYFALLPGAAAAGGMALGVLGPAAGLIGLSPRAIAQITKSNRLFWALLAGFLAWAVLSCLWSANPNHIQAPKLAAEAALGLALAGAAGRSPRMVRAGGLAALVVLTGLLAIEALADMPFSRAAQPGVIDWMLERNPAKGAVILLAMTWPVAAWLLQGRRSAWAAPALFAAAGFLAAQFHQSANLAAYMAGLGGFLAALAVPRAAPTVLAGALALWTLAAPFATPFIVSRLGDAPGLSLSWAARLEIWRYVSAQIPEAPWIGRGLDASRVVNDVIIVQGREMSAVPLHPHSASLQIWYETGFIGAALAAGALIWGGMALSRLGARSRTAAAGACGALAALGVFANVSFGAWQEWWNATLFLSAALCAAAAARRIG